MSHRFTWGLLLGVALGCTGTMVPNDAGLNMGGAGSAHSAGSSGAGVSGEDGSPDDETPGGAGGAAGALNLAGDASVAGEGGLASVQFWTDATQAITIECFGFFAGSATFRAARTELGAAQLSQLTNQTGVPGSSYDGNDDAIHCLVTTADSEERRRQFTIDEQSDLIGLQTTVAAGGAAGAADELVASVLGCEFHHPWSEYPFSASPFCLREISSQAKVKSFLLDLASPGKPYHVELLHCTQASVAGTTVELFGDDPGTPLAIGVAPDDPGPDQACFVLDAQVAAKVVGRLVISSAGSGGSKIEQLIFR